MQSDEIVVFDKDYLIAKLQEIALRGWIPNARHGNHGGIGNTLEDLLGIKENNLPIPNAAEWELKAGRFPTTALTTLFHLDPSPRALQFVTKVLVPLYGWPHQGAGKRHAIGAMSFRQTIGTSGPTGTDGSLCPRLRRPSHAPFCRLGWVPSVPVSPLGQGVTAVSWSSSIATNVRY